MLQRAGWPVPQQRAAANLPLGPKPTKLGPQLLGRPHDQRLELLVALTLATQALWRVASRTRHASRSP
jgi:hypothetical protein